MLHSVEGDGKYAFKSSGMASSDDSSDIAYLRSINEMEMFEKYRDEKDAAPGWVVQENGNQTLIQNARDEFTDAINRARELLEKSGVNDFRHIVIISTGGAEDRYRKDLSEVLNLTDDEVTIYSEGVKWRGVDIKATVPEYPLYVLNNYRFPAFSPITIQLTLKNANQEYSFPFDKSEWYKGKTFTARTSASWDTTFSWTGFDAEGDVTRSIIEKPQFFDFHADSCLAKLWGGDHNHIADNEEIYPGGTFGILTKATFLQATTDDLEEDISGTVPFLDDDEIYAPQSSEVKKKAGRIHKKTSVRIVSGNLHIRSQHSFSILSIFDIKGRLILAIDLRKYERSKGSFNVPLSQLLRGKSMTVMLIRLTGAGKNEAFHMINGRIK